MTKEGLYYLNGYGEVIGFEDIRRGWEDDIKRDRRAWIGFVWLRIGTSGWILRLR
jgi:hypothetical protein